MPKIRKILKWTFLSILLLIVIGVGIVFINGYSMYKEAVSATPLQEKVESIRVSEGYCDIDDVAPDLLTALISVEDKRFYTHIGIDPIASVKATLINLINMEITGGGSTITQQLAKNMYFTQERTYTRKVAELLVAFDLERMYEKKDILELYLNIIYFGHGQTGITAACSYYFDCLPSELSFDQVLYIAGLPQAPSIYSVDDVKAEQRAKQVLEAMIKNGYEYEPQEG